MPTLQSCKLFKCLFPILQVKQSSQSVNINCPRKVFPLQKYTIVYPMSTMNL